MMKSITLKALALALLPLTLFAAPASLFESLPSIAHTELDSNAAIN